MARKARNKFLNGIADTLEQLVYDLTGTKRSRKGQRSYARQATTRSVVIINVGGRRK